MIRIFKLVLLLVVSQVAFGQAPSNYTNINGRYRWIAGMFDSTFHIPKGTSASLRTGGSTNAGALFYNTTDSSVYTYTGTQWIKLRGVVIDTTSLSNRINLKLNISDTASMLAPYLRKVDTASLSNRINLKLNISDTATMLGNYLNNVGYGLIKAGQIVTADSATLATYFLRRKDSLTTTNPLGYVTRKILADTAAAIRSADAGGSVTSVATNNGTGITGGTITTSGTLAIDTTVISTRLWRQKGIDSVQANLTASLATKLNISDTSSMLNPYLRKIDTTNKYVTQVYKKNASDSVFYVKGGNHLWAFNDSTGSAGGGGGGKIYYFNGGVSMGTISGLQMYELGDTANTGAAANFTRSTTGNIANFITDPGKPGLLQIPAGVWSVDAWLSETGGGSNHAEIWIEVEKWDGSTITTIATSPIEQITEGSTPNLYSWSVSIPTTSLTVTDRIIIQFYISNTNGKTVTLYTQNGYIGEVHTTFTTGIGAINGLTAPAQYLVTGTSGTDFNISSVTATHTFNLPTASATNRGALSSADWTTFNNKLNISDTANMLLPYLRKVDTASLSNRINTKLNISDTSTMLGNYVNNVGYGLSKVSQVVSADSATLASYFLRRKDSLTATNLLGYVTGKILADTAAAVRAAAGTIGGSGTANRVSKFTASGTIGNSSIVDSSSSVAMSISSAGNIGVGITPSNWATNYKAFQFNNTSLATFTGLNEQANLALNWYADSGGDKYYYNGASSLYQQSNGNHFFYTAPTGTANNTITFSQRFGVYNDGKVAVGLTSSDSLFSVTQGVHLQRGVRLSGLPTGVGTKALRIDANGTLSIADTTTVGGISGSGTTNYVPKFTGASAIGNSLIYDNGTNVGIGTTTFTYVSAGRFNLALNGGATAGALLEFKLADVSSAYLFSNSTTLELNAVGAKSLTFSNNSSVRATITSGGLFGINTATIGSQFQVNGNAAIGYSASTAAPTNGLAVSGNVGIGQSTANYVIDGYSTSASAARLSITGTSNFAVLQAANTSGTFYTGIDDLAGANFTGVAYGRFIYSSGAYPLIFFTNSAERMRITSGGLLLVGTTSTSGVDKVRVNNDGTTSYSTVNITNANSTANMYVGVGGSAVANTALRNNAYVWNAAATALAFGTSDVEAMRITSGGASASVGIGTSTIGSKLQVNGNAAIGYSASTAAPTDGLAVSGNLGVGTLTPLVLSGFKTLEVKGTTAGLVGVSTVGGAAFGRMYCGTTNMNIGTSTNHPVIFNTNDADRMTITSGGLIGVNTSTIGSQLQVNGNAAIGYSASTAAPTNGLAVSGNVAIGTNTASGRLDISSTSDNYLNILTSGATSAAVLNMFNSVSGGDGAAIGYNIAMRFGSVTGVNAAGFTERMRITSGGELQLKPAANTAALTTSGSYSLTGSNAQSLIDLAGTWNTTGNPTAIKLNITNTASGASANLMDLQVGGTSEFKVTKAGYVGINQGTPTSFLHVEGSMASAITTKSANYTLTVDDYTVGFDCASDRTATLPDATTCKGRVYVIYQYNTGTGTRGVTIDPNGAQTIDGNATAVLIGWCDFTSVMIQSDGSNWVSISDSPKAGCN